MVVYGVGIFFNLSSRFLSSVPKSLTNFESSNIPSIISSCSASENCFRYCVRCVFMLSAALLNFRVPGSLFLLLFLYICSSLSHVKSAVTAEV